MNSTIPLCIAILAASGIAAAQHVGNGADGPSPALQDEITETTAEDKATPGGEAASHENDNGKRQGGNREEPSLSNHKPASHDENDNGPGATHTMDPVVQEAATPPAPGIAVRLERVQTGSGMTVADGVKLRSPFPAKLLAHPPEGWKLEKSALAPAFTRELRLTNDAAVTLTMEPHVLIPAVDGANAFAVAEPGYSADLGYRQDGTVGAILATSIQQLEDESRQLGVAIEQLQQLLVSLPRSDDQSTTDPEQ